jgi:hypothetical protein
LDSSASAKPPDLLILFTAISLLWLGCSRGPAELKQIQQQRSGDYIVSILNESGTVKQRSDHLTLEFRNASTNELVNVNNLQIQASMVMPGMGPMFGNLSSPKQVAAGQYDLEADFAMAGQWNLVITFDPNARVQFALRAQ